MVVGSAAVARVLLFLLPLVLLWLLLLPLLILLNLLLLLTAAVDPAGVGVIIR